MIRIPRAGLRSPSRELQEKFAGISRESFSRWPFPVLCDFTEHMVLTWLSKYRDFGLLLLRIGLGGMMILHGWPKLAGGADTWARVGGAMSHLGITFFPEFWGFMAAVSETLGGALIVLGFLFRPASGALFYTMVVAAVMKYKTSGGVFLEWAWPAEMAIVFLSLIFIGAGRFSLDKS